MLGYPVIDNVAFIDFNYVWLLQRRMFAFPLDGRKQGILPVQ